MTDQLVKDNERVDDLQNGYYVIQDPDKFCFGMDAVLLSGFAKVKKVRLLWTWEQEQELFRFCSRLKQVENISQVLRFSRNVQIWPDAVSCIITWRTMLISCREILKRLLEIFGAASFDVVTSNPPYMIGQHGLRNPDMPKAIARHEVLCNLEDVVSQAAKVLKERGRFYMVHRPFRLAEIMNVLTKIPPGAEKECSWCIHT